MKKALLYRRVSKSADEQKSLGLEGQEQQMREHCQRQGWEVLCVLTDNGVSGGRSSRPALDRAMAMLRAGEADVIVSAKLDRLTRSLAHFVDIMSRATRESWSVVVLDIGIDTSSAAGALMANVMASFAQFERARISGRICEAMAVKRARGDKLGGVWRKGVRLGRLVDDQTVNRVAALYESNGSWRKTAIALNDAGIPTPKGGPWFPASARAVVQRHLPATTAASAA